MPTDRKHDDDSYQRGDQGHPLRHLAGRDDTGHSTGQVNDRPKMGDYSGRGRAGGIRGAGGGTERDERDYRGAPAVEYRGDGGQSGSQAGNMDPPHLQARGLDVQPPGGHRGKGPAGYRRSDQRIHDDVCEVLTHDDHVDASRIDVKVEGGEVTLSGTVTDRDSKRAAEDCAHRIPGVVDVHNRLTVAAG